MKYRLLIGLALLFQGVALAQTYHPPEIDLEQYIEEIFQVQNTDINPEELYETLLLYYSSPLDLNKATAEDLRSLFVLNERQIQRFINYRNTRGDLLSIYELQVIPLFDLPTIRKLLPFTTVNTQRANVKGLLGRILEEENNYLLLRFENTLETRRGFTTREDSTDTRYEGRAPKYYARFRVSHPKDFSIGFTVEKDQGEQFTWNPDRNQYGADFYSAHIQLQNQGKVKNLILGDFQAQYGQSLVFGSGFNVGKGAETINTVRRSNVGLRPYTSAIETNFFRGISATVKPVKNVEITALYSQLQQDGNLRNDTISNSNFVTSIQQSGFHRTRNEIENKNQLTESNLGGTILYSRQRFSLGTGVLMTNFSNKLQRADRVYNQFEFRGRQNLVGTLFGDVNVGNASFFGEMAFSESGGIGTVAGVVASLSSKMEASMVYRNYERNFHSFYGNGFGESTRNINESGIYWGLKYSFSRKWVATAYFDSFRFPWLRPGITGPSSGYEYLGRITYKPQRDISIYAQFREENKADDPSQDEQAVVINFPENGRKRNYLVGVEFPANEVISLKTRVQWSDYSFFGTNTFGYAAWQDINIDLNRIRLSARMAIFDTDDFNNAQYAFERDVLFAFSVPAYSGVGTRQYLVLQYDPFKKLTLWAKISRTTFQDRDQIGSGLDTIEGNKRTDIRIQVRIKF